MPGTTLDLLERFQKGDSAASQELLNRFYEHLKERAGHLMRGERDGHTLQPTALVNEAYIRLVGDSNVRWEGRSHFFALAHNSMRRILIDHARKRNAAKRGGGAVKTTLHDSSGVVLIDETDHLSLYMALERLRAKYERQADVVTLRYFCGLTVDEVAQELEVSPRTIEYDTRFGIAWLRKRLSE